MEVLGQNQPPRRGADAGKVLALPRLDAPEGAQGKPCGASYIPKAHKCSKDSGTGKKLALIAGAVGLGIGAGLAAKKLTTLSPTTRQELKLYAKQSPLKVLQINRAKDIVTAKYAQADEYVSLSSVGKRSIELVAEKYKDKTYIVTFRVDRSLIRKASGTPSETKAILERVKAMLSEQAQVLPSGSIFYAEPTNSDGSGRARRAIYERWGFKDAGDGIGLSMPASDWQRLDATAETGKPCGSSYIPKQHKCSKGAASPNKDRLKTAAKVALALGATAGGIAIAKKFMSMEEWRNHPDNPRNTPKISPELGQKIEDETLAQGVKWDVQEKINARRLADLRAECSGGPGKIQAPAKFDAANPTPRCQAGAGAFGTYFVHQPSQDYGIKLFRNEDADADPGWEFDRMGKAHAAGVNVPEPLAINYTKDGTHTLRLRHLKGYSEAAELYSQGGRDLRNAPLIIQVKLAREFRKLHTEGLAHGDIHGGNFMVNPKSKRVALVDFGYATQIDDAPHRIHNRDGIENLIYDLRRLPDYLGLPGGGNEFLDRNKGVLANIQAQAENYHRSWDKFELGIKRYHDALEAELLWEDRTPRSRFVSGADQPRIPGLTRRILTANANTRQRAVLERLPHGQTYRRGQPSLFAGNAKALGLKPAQLFRALKPERDARKARNRAQPFGTPLRPGA